MGKLGHLPVVESKEIIAERERSVTQTSGEEHEREVGIEMK